jgi:phospholipase/carboxylesterase
MAELSFIHRFEPARRLEAPALLLLHGTGGNEDDLVPLGRMVAPDSALLSVRGKVLENGMPRFFRRLAEGVFDEADLRARAHELADFVEQARRVYGVAAPVALGYSNGANIAAAIMLLRPGVLAGGVLLRAMAPFAEAPAASLAETPVLITSGARDPIIRPENATRLKQLLEQAGAAVEHHILPAGHELSQADVTLARGFVATHAPAQLASSA